MDNRGLICYIIISSLFAGCQNNEPTPQHDNTKRTHDTITNRTPRDPRILTEAELTDDSVFNDGSIPSSWQTAGITDSVRVKQFIRQLQIWVAGNHSDSISPHLLYPMKNPGIQNAADFKKNYQTYFNEAVKTAVMSQKLNQVFRNQYGVMLGEGRLWLTEKDNNILIAAINN
ncbi:MAG: hypothetical protein EOO04_19435 [Chitinophagaceae bacterium]|nr:MAG: hypothetical protein EOO04_19435 [Chitinophagaceae bacterium]